MVKKVVLVGHCGPDASYLRLMVQSALKEAAVIPVDDAKELARILTAGADLLLVNRQLDYGFETESGVELIRQLHAEHPSTRFMLVSNYPDAQSEAIAAGALPGFGKRELGTPQVGQTIRAAMGVGG